MPTLVADVLWHIRRYVREHHSNEGDRSMSEVIQVYNRPAVVEHRYSDVSRVRFQDNGIMGFVANEHVEVEA